MRESIRITVETPTGPSIPVRNAFLGGSSPHLREIKLDGVPSPFPAIRKSFYTRNLVELHLSNIPDDVYFLPNDGPAQTAYGRIPFPCFFPTSSMTPPPPQHTTLHFLMFLDFHGANGYIKDFVARIDLPTLCKIAIRLFNDILFEISQIGQFIPRLNALSFLTGWL
jgi:hypothetical protein